MTGRHTRQTPGSIFAGEITNPTLLLMPSVSERFQREPFTPALHFFAEIQRAQKCATAQAP